MTKAYLIPNKSIEHSIEIKKSKFIAHASFASNRMEAMDVINQVKLLYPDARHHCWAYLFGPPTQAISAAFSDDGEPSGTAGKPILNVLNHKDIGDIIVVVSRYFGGIKLGAGGLVRAYSSATQQAVELLPTILLVPKEIRRMICDYATEPELRRLISSVEGEIISIDYKTDLKIEVQIPLAASSVIEEFAASRQSISLLKPR